MDILKPFEAGDKSKIVIPKGISPKGLQKQAGDVFLNIPCRLHYMVLDLSGIYYRQAGGGGISLGSDVYTTKARVSFSDEEGIHTKYPSSLHTALVLKEILGFEEGLNIDIDPIRKTHCGFSSTQGKNLSAAIGINELFGNPLTNRELRRVIADNYVEGKDGKVVFGLETGSAPAIAMYGGLHVIDKDLNLIGLYYFPDDYSILTYLPNGKGFKKSEGFGYIDEAELTKKVLESDRRILDKKKELLNSGLLPSMRNGDIEGIRESLNEMTDIYYDNWVGMAYGEQVKQDIKDLKKEGFIVGMSSTGSAIFLTGKDDRILDVGKYIEDKHLCEDFCSYGKPTKGMDIIRNGNTKRYVFNKLTG